jgi:uncharacterized protein with PIN domain
MQTKLLSPEINQFNSQSEQIINQCPYCNSLIWVKLHRSWWQKILYPRKNLCFCRNCRQEFWRDSYD